ncbi:hypothetical protein EO238_31315, partial [Citrobacter sp. AAK_AS5]
SWSGVIGCGAYLAGGKGRGVGGATPQGRGVVLAKGVIDATGNAAQNAELAKQRAMAVRDKLVALGVAEGQVELQKPADIQAG